jgi:[ribosomal protein S18]-alanine N-acetyltransferase
MVDTDFFLRDYNIAYTRRRYLKPMVSDAELKEMAELERICFPPPTNYDLRTLRIFASLNGAGLLRRREIVDDVPKLVAFMLFDCLTGELITVDVHPDFRRLGLGRKLMAEAIKKFTELGHSKVTSQVATTNESSLAMHKDLGFVVGRVLKNYYGPGRDAYNLTAKLQKSGE